MSHLPPSASRSYKYQAVPNPRLTKDTETSQFVVTTRRHTDDATLPMASYLHLRKRAKKTAKIPTRCTMIIRPETDRMLPTGRRRHCVGHSAVADGAAARLGEDGVTDCGQLRAGGRLSAHIISSIRPAGVHHGRLESRRPWVYGPSLGQSSLAALPWSTSFRRRVGTTPIAFQPQSTRIHRNASSEIESSDHAELTACPEATNDLTVCRPPRSRLRFALGERIIFNFAFSHSRKRPPYAQLI